MLFSFEDFTLDSERRELRAGGTIVPIEPQVFDLLVCLIENRDRVVSKDDLIASVWSGRIVSDSTMDSRINAVRKALGDSGKKQRLIQTIARKGIRFVGDVHVQPMGLQPQAEIHEPSRVALSLPDRPAIAVLPFLNMSDEKHEYFSDGISEDIITALSKLRWFFVIARNSSFIYKDKAVHIKQIAEELGVGYVVEGSVRKSGDRVRITAQLIDVETGSHIWAERYDRGIADVFAVQDEITEAIVAAIEPQIYAAENFHAQRKPPDSLDAWDLVMRALSHYWRVTREDNLKAQALLEQAIAIDADYGQALAVLAVSHTFGAHMGWRTWQPLSRSPNARDWRRFGPTARTLGRISPLLPPTCTCAVLMTRLLSSNWRCALIRTSPSRKAIMGWGWHTLGGGRKASKLPVARCA